MIVAMATMIHANVKTDRVDCHQKYEQIKQQLENKDISLQEAQKLWYKHKRSHGKTKVIS